MLFISKTFKDGAILSKALRDILSDKCYIKITELLLGCVFRGIAH